jgi:hypothetical protein
MVRAKNKVAPPQRLFSAAAQKLIANRLLCLRALKESAEELTASAEYVMFCTRLADAIRRRLDGIDRITLNLADAVSEEMLVSVQEMQKHGEVKTTISNGDGSNSVVRMIRVALPLSSSSDAAAVANDVRAYICHADAVDDVPIFKQVCSAVSDAYVEVCGGGSVVINAELPKLLAHEFHVQQYVRVANFDSQSGDYCVTYAASMWNRYLPTTGLLEYGSSIYNPVLQGDVSAHF